VTPPNFSAERWNYKRHRGVWFAAFQVDGSKGQEALVPSSRLSLDVVSACLSEFLA